MKLLWRSSYHSRIAQLADFVVVISGFILSYYCYVFLNKVPPFAFMYSHEMSLSYLFIFFIIGLIYVLLFNYQNAYSYQRFTSLIKEYSIVFRVSTFGLLFVISIFFLYGLNQVPKEFFLIYFLISEVLFMCEKTLLFYVASFIRKKGRNRKRVIIIGTGSRAQQFIKTVKNNFQWGLDILGLLSGESERVGCKVFGIKVIGTYSEIESILKTLNPEEVIITISTKRFDQIRDILEQCERIGINVRLNSDFFGHLTKNVTTDNIFGLNIISFYPTRLSEFDTIVKRTLDLIVSLIALLILLPILLLLIFVIYLQDGKPIFYKWKVVGYNRKSITSWKFRTMVKNADDLKEKLLDKNEMTGPMFKLSNDPRILPIGKFLRKYSLDELPQLLSVLKGDLSLVGPRPPLQSEFKEFDLWHRRKLSMKPGLTCLWQVSGRNKINDFDEWAKLDLQYIDHWSIWLDLKILLKTIPAVLSGNGAK